MKKLFFTIAFFLFYLSAFCQETWNRVYENPLTDVDGQAFTLPTGLFLNENEMLVFADAGYCLNCEGQYKTKLYKVGYDGNIIDTTWFPVESDDLNAINATSEYNGMFRNDSNQIVSFYYSYLPDTIYAEIYHQTMVHYNNEQEVIQIDTIWDLSNQSNEFYRLQNGTHSNNGYLVSGYTHDDSLFFSDSRGFISELNPATGEVNWIKDYPDLFHVMSVEQDEEGNIWALANIQLGGYYMFLKMDSVGNILKQHQIGFDIGYERDAYFLLEEDRAIIGGFLANDFVDEDHDPGTGTYFTLPLYETETGFSEGPLKRYGHNNYYTLDASGIYAHTDTSYILYGSYRQTELPWNRGLAINLNQELDTNWFRMYRFIHPEHYVYEQTEHYLNFFEPLPNGEGFIGCGHITNSLLDPFPIVDQLWLFRTDEYGCLEPGCQDVNVEEITIGLENVMTVYPNPATDFVTVEFDFPAGYSPPNSGEFRLMSMDGKEVLRKEVSAGVFDSPLRLDVSTLNSGVYILHWTDGKKWFDSVRAIIN